MNSLPSEDLLYELRVTEDRGLALFAARDLAAGSRIVQEEPLFAIPYNAAVRSAKPSAILSAFQDLMRDHPDRAASYMNLHRRSFPNPDLGRTGSDLEDDDISPYLEDLSLTEQKSADIYTQNDDKSYSTADGRVNGSTIMLPRGRRDSGHTEGTGHTKDHHKIFPPEAEPQHSNPSAPVSTSASHETYTSETIINIFETNSLGIEIPPTATDGDNKLVDPRHAAICLETSRLNHSCIPNLVCGFNASTGFHTVHAIRDIAAGEELCISYIRGSGMIRSQRREELAKYQFECVCAVCSGKVEGSDDRRSRIRVLQETADMAKREMEEGLLTPEGAGAAVEVLRELITLMKAEGLVDLNFADLCGAAGLCCLRAGRVGEALAWWDWKVEVLLCCLGSDGPAYLRESKALGDFKLRLQALSMQ